MLFIDNTFTDAYFNIAAEEYLFRNFSDPVFMLWQNEPCVIIGRNQNLMLEANAEVIKERNIKVVRRFSGGGTVYQDLGNVNLTFIAQGNKPDFDNYARQMLQFLTTIGIKAQSDNRRGLYIEGLKISGSAQYIRGNKTLYHATLLFSSNLTDLILSLDNQNANLNEYEVLHPWHNVRSVRSPVTNIENHLTTQLSISEFKKMIMKQFIGLESTNKIYQFSEDDIASINSLKQKKYETRDWNYRAKILN
ncbi:MAG: lipoate--protein ligase family protein [Paludibacter sp.]|nr:lipoate--protein ligase family protein [Paludibacter sp.]